MGYDFMGSKMYTPVGRIFQLNVDNYPYSYNVYDSYGDYFMAVNDTANAMIQFEKALAIQENEGSTLQLETLKGAGKK